MKTWPRHPVIYEVNTWVWLNDLSRKYQRPVNLATVPEQEWDAIASSGLRRRLVHGCVGAEPCRDWDLHAKRGAPRGFQEGPPRLCARRTMSARPTACAATSLTNISAGRRDLPPRDACSANADCG